MESPRPMSLAHDGITIRVDAPGDDRAWLAEFLEPSFSRPARDGEGVHVVFEEAAGGALAAPDSSGRSVAFALDSDPVRLPTAPQAGGIRLCDHEAGVVFEVCGGGRETRIRYNGSRLAARMRLMRVVREYAHNHSLRTGGLILHAAALASGGRALAVAGAKGTGKTTLALRLLETPGAAYLANDRVLVRLDADVKALGVPTVVALRPGTLALFPEMGARLRVAGDFRQHRGEREARGPSRPVETDGGLRLSAAQLCAMLGRRAEAAAPLAAVVFPWPGRGAALAVRRLEEGEAVAALAESLLGRGSGTFTSEVFVHPPAPAPDEAELRSRCRALASRIPIYVGGLRDGASVEDAAALLRSCLEARA